jgi:hypothetical protein
MVRHPAFLLFFLSVFSIEAIFGSLEAGMGKKGIIGALVGITTALTGSATGGSSPESQYKAHSETQHAKREERIERASRSESRTSAKSGKSK